MSRRRRLTAIAGTGLCLAVGVARADHQPIMDMAPRWSRGWGVQVQNEWRASDQVVDGDSSADNPFGRRRRVNTTWIEAAYTHVPEFKVTVKVPVIDQQRVIVRGGRRIEQRGSGVGDVVLGAQVKRLYIGPAWGADLGVTGSVRLPSGSTAGGFPVGDGSTDLGLSLTYKRDTARSYQFYDVFYWFNTRGDSGINVPADGDELGLDVNWGILPYHNNQLNAGVWAMWDLQVRYAQRGVDADGVTGGFRVSTGPMVMFYKDNLLLHAQLDLPAYEHLEGAQVSYGPQVMIGVGVSF